MSHERSRLRVTGEALAQMLGLPIDAAIGSVTVENGDVVLGIRHSSPDVIPDGEAMDKAAASLRGRIRRADVALPPVRWDDIEDITPAGERGFGKPDVAAAAPSPEPKPKRKADEHDAGVHRAITKGVI